MSTATAKPKSSGQWPDFSLSGRTELGVIGRIAEGA
jgi:hypothetical protein